MLAWVLNAPLLLTVQMFYFFKVFDILYKTPEIYYFFKILYFF